MEITGFYTEYGIVVSIPEGRWKGSFYFEVEPNTWDNWFLAVRENGFSFLKEYPEMVFTNEKVYPIKITLTTAYVNKQLSS